MSDTRRLKNSEKVRALKSFLDNGFNCENDYDVESLQKGIKDFLDLESVSKSEYDLSELIDNYVAHHITKKSTQAPKAIHEIDFTKTTNSELIDDALQPIRGMMAILSSMAVSTRGGDDEFQSQSYNVLQKSCSGVLDKFEELKPEIDYMEDIIRGKIN